MREVSVEQRAPDVTSTGRTDGVRGKKGKEEEERQQKVL